MDEAMVITGYHDKKQNKTERVREEERERDNQTLRASCLLWEACGISCEESLQTKTKTKNLNELKLLGLTASLQETEELAKG